MEKNFTMKKQLLIQAHRDIKTELYYYAFFEIDDRIENNRILEFELDEY